MSYPLEDLKKISHTSGPAPSHGHDPNEASNLLVHNVPECDQIAGAESTTTTVELSISCSDLPDCDIVSKSDPQVFVYLVDLGGTNKKCEIGRTEMIADNLNPKFAKKIFIQYHFEQIQKLRFEVYDIDSLGGNDFLGALDTTLADIIAARSSTFKKPLVGGPRKRPGYIIIDAEELISCKQVTTFTISAIDLKPSFCGLLSPSTSIYVYRSNENGSMTIVHRSPCTLGCNPAFKPIQMKLMSLCNGDLDRSIRFELVDRRLNMERNLGFFETTINEMKTRSKDAHPIGPSKKIKREVRGQLYHLMQQNVFNHQNSVSTSKVVVSDFKLMTQATFLDYIKAGAQIHFVVAVDFTASNGDPAYPDSLHYLDPMRRNFNPYEAALQSVGNILKAYDTIGMFAGFGFGAKLLGPNRPPSHLFPLNGNDQHPYVTSIDELLQVYRNKLKNVILSGPTNFAPCIAHCSSIAQQFEDGNHYFVLLIVTDGIISDMYQTKKAVIEASKSPLSIIVCGVGDADFSAMNELDSDDVVMTVDGKSAERDIVQFVPMNQFTSSRAGNRHKPGPTYLGEAQRLLAEEVLKEIPDQLTGYMVARGFHQELTFSES